LSTGNYVNISENITAIDDTETVTGNAATATLDVIAAPSLVKEFVNDPVIPGATVDLQFTLTHDETAPGDATAISFTDDLSATLAGLLATGLPMNDVCGAGSVLSGTTQLTLSDGLLAPGANCTFTVTLDVPVNAIAGNHANTTSSVSATVSGIAVMESAASDDLNVAGLVLSKAFTDDPVLPGATVTLEFTISNSSPISDATGILFFDNLSDVIPGLTAISLPANDFCGAGSTITGTTTLIMSGGNLLAGESCTFAVTLQVPGSVASNIYNNTTSNLFATIEAQNLTLNSATDNLVVNSDLLMLTKSFTDDPVAPGANVTLEFTINNLDPVNPIIDITFTDDLDSVLSGMTATGLPASDICGSGSSISGTGLLAFSGGTLAAGASCTFSVTLQVPADVSLGTIAQNTTDIITGMLNGFAVNGDPAIDELRIDSLDFSKAFAGPAVSNGSSVLSFTINNLDAAQSLNNLEFTDDLEAMIPGLMATGLPLGDVCGIGSQLTGTSFLTLAGGNLLAAGSCTFDVTLQMPADVTPGDYINTTSDLRVEGLPTSIPATATLTVINQAPDCSGATPSQATLWPPDLSFQAITLQGVSDPDSNPLTISVTSIFQDENVDSTGDGAFVPDGQGIGTSTASIRAERIDPLNLSPVSPIRSSSKRHRSGRVSPSNSLPPVSMGFATGRVYHITYNVNDGNGGSCDAEVLVSVPVVENGVALDEGAIFDSTAN
jgi:hypothetical protein